MEFKAKLLEKTSKNGNTYFVLEIKLTDTYSKVVFLDKADLEIIKLTNASK